MKPLEQLYDTLYIRFLRHTTIPPYHHNIPCCTIPSHTVTFFTVPSRTIQHHTIPGFAIPHHTILYHGAPHHTSLHHTTLCHAMLCHIAEHKCTAHRIKSHQISTYFNITHQISTYRIVLQHHTPYFTTPHTMLMPPHSMTHITTRSYYTLPQHLNITSHITHHHHTTTTHTYMYSRCNRIVTSTKSIRIYPEHKTRMSKDVRT